MNSDFQDWKRHPITTVIMSEFAQRIQLISETLLENAGSDPIKDARLSGVAKAYMDIVNITLDDLSKEGE